MNKEHEEKIQKNIEVFSDLVENIVSSPRKELISSMMESDFAQLYFTAPASSRENYHYAWPGGLVSHSFNVYKNLRKLNEAFKLNFSEESMFIVSMFHDIGKACATNMTEPHYVPSVEQWKLNKGILYEYNENGVYMPNHLRSIFILMHFSISLSAEEFQAIYLNDGQYLTENKPYALKESKLALYLHMADRIALEQERK